MRLPSLVRFFVAVLFSAFFLIVVAPGCGRSSLELETESDGGGVQPANCGPSNCPGGCCDSSGTCRIGSDTRACGANGQRCSDCIANGFEFCDGRRVCGRSVSNCGPNECPSGCCSFDSNVPECLAGTDPGACGISGEACTDCLQQGRTCDTFSRTCGTGKCDASNCNGCCVGDKCLPGNGNQSCGNQGQACVSCLTTGQTCAGSPSGGGHCVGTASCGPGNCGGCCNGNTCVSGSDSVACGKQGQACSNCTSTGKTCVPQGQPNERTCQTPVTCNAATCPGCCVGNNCVVATTPAACGKGGQACKSCNVNETCSSGVCTPAPNCSPANCAGCCIGTDICAIGNQDTACGLSGIQCNNCTGAGKVCQGGACQTAVCGPANCAGCCSGNTCVLGTQDNACGQNGGACADCTPSDEVCQGRQCRTKCGPTTFCPTGCCTAANACAVGFTNSACGSDGAACADCTAAAATCNTLGSPRVCSNQVGKCPAPFPSCGAGVSTAVTASLQGVCDDTTDLDAIRAACAGGPQSGTCNAAFHVLAATNPGCAACLTPFNEPFTQLTGIYRCVAPFVTNACNHSTGCATTCQDTSCDQCPGGTEDQCRNQANAAGGQCNAYVQQTACALGALGGGSLCSPGTYANYGGWIRAVGDHFCGNGP